MTHFPRMEATPVAVTQADGWVVVARAPGARVPTYDWYSRLDDAMAEFLTSSLEPLGIFPTQNGLPIGKPLSNEAIILAVTTLPPYDYITGLRADPDSPENRMLAEAAQRDNPNGERERLHAAASEWLGKIRGKA